MATLLRYYTGFCLIHFITCACKLEAKPCEWEPWQPWSSCSRTCGVGYRNRKRNLCCGPILTDCASTCFRGDNNKQVVVCNDSCPNGATLVDGICQCPPLKYGVCCDIDESTARGGIFCARHCTWFNWYSWGDCSTSCGCGTRERTRSRCCRTTLSSTQCANDCNMHDNMDTRSCTNPCSSESGPNGCTLCSWNNWGSWSSCSSTCGGGQRLKSRSACCCSGQTAEECFTDCGLLETDATQKKPCNKLCFNKGSFINNSCVCLAWFTGTCCSTEVMVSDCKTCSWQTWQPWEDTGEDGKMRRKRELCCRIGQSAEDCMSECEVDEHSQLQILLNPERQSENQTSMNATIATKLETAVTDPYLYLYAVVISVVSVILTSIAWVVCYHLRKKRSADQDKKTVSDPPTENIYEMSVTDAVMDHEYHGVDPGSINNESNYIYANAAF